MATPIYPKMATPIYPKRLVCEPNKICSHPSFLEISVTSPVSNNHMTVGDLKKDHGSILPNFDFFICPIFTFKLGHFKV